MGTGPIGGFTIGGIPSDILAGHSITATILADDAAGNPLDGYTGPISVRISDPQNNTIYSTSGNFDPSQFTLGPVTLNDSGTSPVTDTITITAGATTVSLPVVVHPVSQFVADGGFAHDRGANCRSAYRLRPKTIVAYSTRITPARPSWSIRTTKANTTSAAVFRR